MIVEITLMVLLIGLSGLFSATETALFSFSKEEWLGFSRGLDPKMRLASGIMAQPDQVLTSLLVGNNAVNIMLVLTAGRLLHGLLGRAGESTAQAIARLALEVALITGLVLIGGEILPKNLALKHPKGILHLSFYPFYGFHRLLGALHLRGALALSVRGMVGAVRRIFGERNESADTQDIRLAISLGTQEGHLEDSEAALAERVLQLKDFPLGEIMTDRSLARTVFLDDSTVTAVRVGLLWKSGRIPVYDKSSHSVVGVFDVHRAIARRRRGRVREYVQAAQFVPLVNPTESLLALLEAGEDELGIVVDEFGSYTGVIHSRDIVAYLCEPAGFTAGSRSTEPAGTRRGSRMGQEGYFVDADARLESVEEILNTPLPRGDYQTIGGLVLDSTGAIPKQGRWVVAAGHKFYIDAAKPNRILRVFIPHRGGN